MNVYKLTVCSQYANIVTEFQVLTMHLISAGKLKDAASTYSNAAEIVKNFIKKLEYSN